MKVKDFKTQLKNEHLDIPNVLDNIKNIAYSAEYKPHKKQSYFKLNTFLKYSISFCLFIIIGILLIPTLNNPGTSAPESNMPESPSSEQEQHTESPENGKPARLYNLSQYEIDIYNSYWKNDYQSVTEPFDTIDVLGNSLIKANVDNKEIIILNYEIFNYLKLFILENNDISLDDCLNNIYVNYGLNKDYYETILNAYTFIIEKDQ